MPRILANQTSLISNRQPVPDPFKVYASSSAPSIRPYFGHLHDKRSIGANNNLYPGQLARPSFSSTFPLILPSHPSVSITLQSHPYRLQNPIGSGIYSTYQSFIRRDVDMVILQLASLIYHPSTCKRYASIHSLPNSLLPKQRYLNAKNNY